jgi:cell wall-associated NlpC family hydrolase
MVKTWKPGPTRSDPLRWAPMRRVLPCLALTATLLMAGCGSAPQRPGSAQPSLSGEQSSDIAIHAMGLVGTPYRYGGNTPESGFDCSGLIGYVYKSRAGVAPPRTVAQLSGFGQPVSARDLRTGDLVIFGEGRPFHAGIYVGEGRFVHAPSTGGTVRLDRLNNVYWARQTTTFRRP